MITTTAPAAAAPTTTAPGSYRIPFVMITALFFLSGFTFAILDVLNRHFQVVLNISKAESGLIQSAVCSAYFLVAIPAGMFMRRYGYRRGVLAGLTIAAIGAALFLPAGTIIQSFWAFLLALFILACGLTFLEIAANPYITILGPPESGPFRLNLAQSFNGVGWILGPVVGGLAILGTVGAAGLTAVLGPFLVLGSVILIIGLIFLFRPLPENLEGEATVDAVADDHGSLWHRRHFVAGVLVQFLYCGAQQAVNAFALNFILENRWGSSADRSHDQAAAFWISVGLMCFAAGRFASTAIMRWVAPERMLVVYGIASAIVMAAVIADIRNVSWIILLASWFFMSIMYPTIFSLGIRGLGTRTKLASSILVMAILGGAFTPPLMGLLADRFGTALSFGVPLIGFLAVAAYGLGYRRLLARPC